MSSGLTGGGVTDDMGRFIDLISDSLISTLYQDYSTKSIRLYNGAMNGGESQFSQATDAMLLELHYQAELSQTPHHFTYKFRESNKGVGRLLDQDEQLMMLQYLDSKGMISLGIDMFNNDVGRKYVIELNDKAFDSIKDQPSSHSTHRSIHTAQLIFEDVYLKVVIDNTQTITIRRFQDKGRPSDPYKLFTRLFSMPIGQVHRLVDIFPTYDNLTKVIKDAKLAYLLPIFFADKGSKELQLLKMPVQIIDEVHELLLSKSK